MERSRLPCHPTDFLPFPLITSKEILKVSLTVKDNRPSLYSCRGEAGRNAPHCSQDAPGAARDRFQGSDIPTTQPGERGIEDEEGRDGSGGCRVPYFSY